MGITVASFQIAGISACWRDELKRAVRKARPEGPRCLRWCTVSVSGPEAVEEPDLFMASATSAGVKWRDSWSKG